MLRCSITDAMMKRARQIRGFSMSLQTLMQAGPTKANEIFAKLAETSSGAVKTRERLFSDLKSELELHTSLEEQHLFPVLERHEETKPLVDSALKDNMHLRALLDQLSVIPANDDAFGALLLEVQLAFKLHAMDEKSEILPAVKHALSETQIQHIEQGFETGVADAERVRHEMPKANPTDIIQQNIEAAGTNVVKLADTLGAATRQASETVAQTAEDWKGYQWLEVYEQAMDARKRLFWQITEHQLQFTADVAKWWIERNEAVIRQAMSPFAAPARQ
jgi:hypothetical protein